MQHPLTPPSFHSCILAEELDIAKRKLAACPVVAVVAVAAAAAAAAVAVVVAVVAAVVAAVVVAAAGGSLGPFFSTVLSAALFLPALRPGSWQLELWWQQQLQRWWWCCWRQWKQ